MSDLSINSSLASLSPLVSDIASYLVGTWTRTLKHQIFGFDYVTLKTSTSVIQIEEYISRDPEPNTRYLKWSFGKQLNGQDLKFGYVMKFIRSEQPELGQETTIEYQYSGLPCTGIYNPVTATIVLNFNLKVQTQIITYRIQNESSLAVCIVETDEAAQPTVQLGNMNRVKL